jgi:type II secretory ATPase GspE/PulE/Tfp pilus assembly ATPase PilB-like protein
MSANPDQLQKQLSFQTELNQIGAAIHSASSIPEILLNATDRISRLLRCERLTIYAIDSRSNQLYSIFKQGEDQGPKVIRIPRDANSIAGFCAISKKTVNINDVYDLNELGRIHSTLRFDQRWDRAMGFRTRQVLAIPLVFERYLLGVMQMINKVGGGSFTGVDEAAAEEICRTLAIAFYNQRRAKRATPGKRGKLFDLVDKGMISEKALEDAVTYARINNKDLGFVLIEQHDIPKEEVGRSLSDFYGCEFFLYDGSQRIPQEIMNRVKADFWKKMACVPVRREGRNLKVAVVDPFDLNKIDVIKSTAIAPNVEVMVGLEQDIVDCLNQSYGIEEVFEDEQDTMAEILTELEAEAVGDSEPEEEETEELSEEVQGAVVRLTNKIIIDAYKQGVSDIHVEPYGVHDDCVIRFRRDGECFEYQQIPASNRNALVSRLKIMSQLDISERRKPQDGKIRFRLPDGNIIELRVAVVPTAGANEDVVMRILAASKPIPLDKLGMHPDNYEAFAKAVKEPYGLILCVGPTGSGKTTTLHSALGAINTEKIKIWTAEDPVEITQKGLRQVQVQAKIGFTFAAAMRSFLRADPDVVMIGEMRDEETAAIGIEASLTGHLVFSTLHTNSAPETITRLLDMGLDPFNFSDALLAVLAQRLVRTLCKKCKEPYTPSQEEFAALREAYGAEVFDRRLGITYSPELKLHRPKGCKACTDTGYRGRMGLHELLLGTDPIKKLVLQRKPVKEIRDAAIAGGMTTLLQDGIWKVLEGNTDFKQVRSVCIR